MLHLLARQSSRDDRPPRSRRQEELPKRSTIAGPSRLVMKTDRNRLVPPRILQLVAAVARKHETHAEFFGRLAERANLIAGRRGER